MYRMKLNQAESVRLASVVSPVVKPGKSLLDLFYEHCCAGAFFIVFFFCNCDYELLNMIRRGTAHPALASWLRRQPGRINPSFGTVAVETD